MVNPNLEQYKLLGPQEVPEIEVVVLEDYRANSATDAYGIAEPSNIATAPAIANAVYNAIGVRIRTLPMTPAVILAALGKTSARS
jgi:xanthine dehydrogenase YagR molybdenum-binding subunit